MIFKFSTNAAAHSSAYQPVMMGGILSALSLALDITEGAQPGRSVRACLLGTRLDKQIGLPDQALNDSYYALLFRTPVAAAMPSAAADQVAKRHFKFIDREKLGKLNREALAFVWNNVAPTTSVWNRRRHMYHLARSPGD